MIAKVKILKISEFEIFPTFGEARKLKKIEYQMEGFVPRFIFIPAEQFSRDFVKRKILEDLKNLFPDLEDIQLEGI